MHHSHIRVHYEYVHKRSFQVFLQICMEIIAEGDRKLKYSIFHYQLYTFNLYHKTFHLIWLKKMRKPRCKVPQLGAKKHEPGSAGSHDIIYLKFVCDDFCETRFTIDTASLSKYVMEIDTLLLELLTSVN